MNIRIVWSILEGLSNFRYDGRIMVTLFYILRLWKWKEESIRKGQYFDELLMNGLDLQSRWWAFGILHSGDLFSLCMDAQFLSVAPEQELKP